MPKGEINMIKIVNLTPHELSFVVGDNETRIPTSGIIARVSEKIEIVGNVNGIPIIKKTFGEVEGLPPAVKDTVFVVSLLTAQAASERKDVFVVGETIRNEKGQVVAAKSLAVV